MSGFISKVLIEQDFDGDHVKVVVRPMSYIDRIALEEALPGPNAPEEERKVAASRVARLGIEKLAPYIESVTGLTDAGGTALDKESLTRDAYFLDLAGRIFWLWFEAAAPKRPTKPAGGSGDASAVSS